MTNADKLQAQIGKNQEHLLEYQKRCSPIIQRIRGWSNAHHYLFFKSWMDAFPEKDRPLRILIVGVYLGRDISFMLDAAGEQVLEITGVDKFNAEPCDDWPAEKRGMTWEQAFNCPPPDRETALNNILAHTRPDSKHVVKLVKADDKDWLESATGAYDLIFLDASHEYESISRQIRAVHKLCHPFTVISGDDYANEMATWGVETAVKEAFKSHYHIDNRIWFAGAEDYL